MMKRISQLLVFVSLLAFGWTDSTKPEDQDRAITLLDVSIKNLDKARSLLKDCSEKDFQCRNKTKALDVLNDALNILKEATKDKTACLDLPKDCSDVLESGQKKSGVYSIWPRSEDQKSLSVYCDMDTDGGGWTVIQRRGSFSTPKDYFYKGWKEYKNGFGKLTEEFWLGNDNIHAITKQDAYKLRFDLKSSKGETGYAVYDKFEVEDETSQYRLAYLGGYSGNVGNAMSMTSANQAFSTKDRNNGKPDTNCAAKYHSAWWYYFDYCSSQANPNGLYQPGTNADESAAWYNWKSNREGLASIEMKLRVHK